MRPFLVVSIAIIPIVLTGTAFGIVSDRSQRYMLAQANLIRILEQYSERNTYDSLMRLKDIVERFLADENPDVRQLADAIAQIAEAAGRLNKDQTRIIIKILRHGSDGNRALYLLRLLDDVKPPTRGGERSSPDPDPSPSPATYRVPEPARRAIEAFGRRPNR